MTIINGIYKLLKVLSSLIFRHPPTSSLMQEDEYYEYFVTFIDDCSRFTWIYFLQSKGEIFLAFKTFLALIETQFSSSIKILRSISKGEYMCLRVLFYIPIEFVFFNKSWSMFMIFSISRLLSDYFQWRSVNYHKKTLLQSSHTYFKIKEKKVIWRQSSCRCLHLT